MRAVKQALPGMPSRAAWFALLVGGLVSLTGCATKRDIRDLQTEMASLRASQDSAVRLLQRENRMLLDSLRRAMELTQNTGGQTTYRYQQLETALADMRELVGQVVQMGQSLSSRLDNFENRAPAGALGPASPAAETSDLDTLYALGTQYLGEGSYGTARRAFQQLLAQSRTHERSPDAQFQIGESYAGEKDYERAIEALVVVAEEWPDSERAPQALYRAGLIAADSLSPKQPRQARQLLQRVIDTYSGSPSAGLARTKLRSLPR